MKKLSFLIAALFVVAGAANAQITLYNNLGGTYAGDHGDSDGGSNTFGANYGLESGQVITDSGASSISSVELLFDAYSSSSAATGFLVQVYNFSGGVVGSLVGSQDVSSYSEVDSSPSNINTPYQWDITAATNIAGLVSGNQYLVAMQNQSANYAYAQYDTSGNPGTYLRDYSSNGYPGGYGFTNWEEAGSAGFGAGNQLMEVEGQQAVPAPAGVWALGLGLGAVLLRRRK